jgi:hypothetical protein
MQLDYEKLEEAVFNAGARVDNYGVSPEGLPAAVVFLFFPVLFVLARFILS